MKKTISALAASMFFTSTAFAVDTPAPKHCTCAPFNGFFAGGLLGYGYGKAKTNLLQAQGAPAQFVTKINVALNGPNAGFFLGYGETISSSQFYFGFTASYIFDGSRGIETAPGALNATIKRQDSFDLDGRIGFVVSNTMSYLGVGWANSKIQGENLGIKFLNKRLNGFKAMIGVDWKFSPHLLAGLICSWTTFPRSGNGALTPFFIPVPTPNINQVFTTALTDSKIQIKLAYLF